MIYKTNMFGFELLVYLLKKHLVDFKSSLRKKAFENIFGFKKINLLVFQEYNKKYVMFLMK